MRSRRHRTIPSTLICALLLLIAALPPRQGRVLARQATPLTLGSAALAVGDPLPRIQCVPGYAASVYAQELRSPDGLAFSPAGLLYVAEERAGRVSQIVPPGGVTPVLDGLDKPEAIAFDDAGNLYVVEDVEDGRLIRMDSGGATATLALDLEASEGVAWVPGGTLYATESNLQFADNPLDLRTRIAAVPPSGEVTRIVTHTPTLSGTEVAFWSYAGMARGPDGLLYVANELSGREITQTVVVVPGVFTYTLTLFTSDSVFAVDPAAGSRALFASDLVSPEGLHFAANGDFPLYVVEEDTGDGEGRLSRIGPDGRSSVLCTGFLAAEDVAVDGQGRLYVSEDENGLIILIERVPAALISALYYDTYLSDEPEEAFRLTNVGESSIDLAGWTVSDGEGTVTLAGTLEAGQDAWIARQASSFAEEFGFAPDYEYGADSDPAVPDLARSGSLILANAGDQLTLQDGSGALVDAVVYEGASTSEADWIGPGVEPYAQGTFEVEGQVLYRKLDQASGLPLADTDTAADWAQATDDDVRGKKVMYPGWDLERYFYPTSFTETATITYAVAPDHIYEAVLAEINRAGESLYYQGYTFQNAHLAEAIVARMTANPGMTVTVLLEGGPSGGISDQEKWICQQIENAGGQVYFFHNDDATDVHDRYDDCNARSMIVDERTLLTGSEDLDDASMPADDKADGTSGRRGVWLIADAPSAVAHALDVFRHDLDPDHHKDLFRWTAGHATYGAPPPGFTPDYVSGGTAYAIQFPTPLAVDGTLAFEMVQSPENSLRDADSLLGMVARAGHGDTVLVEQLQERTFWGAADSNPAQDPNPRLEAYIDAARRGATVRILLDAAGDDPGDPRGNAATCAYVEQIATDEGLDLSCRLGDPAGEGMHNKMVLVLDGGQGCVHTGGIDGSEEASKNSRAVAVQVQSTAAYDYLAGVFWHDWYASGADEPTPPQAGFTAWPTAGTAPLRVTFTNATSGDYDASLWDFGDGITSTVDSPIHTYARAGTYGVSLTVSGPGGCDAETKAAFISARFGAYLPAVLLPLN